MSSSDSKQVILITAGSGTIGSRLVPMLLQDPTQPKIVIPTGNASRVSKKYGDLSSQSKSEFVIEEGNIDDTMWVESILVKHKVSSIFLCLAGLSELFTTLNFLDAIKHAKCVKHVVYLSVGADVSIDAVKAGPPKCLDCAHMAVKIPVEAKLKYGTLPADVEGGFTYTIMGPTLFFDNDLRSKKSLMEKSFFDESMPPLGVSRVSPSDIALAVYNSLIHDRGQKHHGDKIMIGSKKAFTHKDMTELWSAGLKKQIKVSDASNEDDMHALEKHIAVVRDAPSARDVKLMYETFAMEQFSINDVEYKKQVEFLGKEPESYEKFVAETTAKWLEEEKAQ